MDELMQEAKSVEKLLRKNEKPEFYEKTASRMEVFDYAPGEPVYEDGDSPEDGLYIIISGTAEVYSPGGDYLFSLREGDFFGAEALFTSLRERREYVRAKTELRVASLSREGYRALEQEDGALPLYLSTCLFARYDKKVRRTEKVNADKERGAKGILFALFLLFFTSYYSNLLSELSSAGSVTGGAVILYFLGITGICVAWFFVGRIPRNEMGIGNYVTWKDTVINLGVLAELCALFFLGAMLADSGIMTSLISVSDLTGTGYFIFIVLALIYTLIYIICVGFLPVAVEKLLPTRLGRILAYLTPCLFAMIIFGSIGGAISALWLGITVLSLTWVRIHTGNTIPTAVTFLLALIIGSLFFHITYIPLMFTV